MKFGKTILLLATAALCAAGVGAAVALASGDSDDTLPVSKAFKATSTTATTFTTPSGAAVSCPAGKSVLEFSTNASGTIAQVDNLTSKTFGPGCTVTGGATAEVTTTGTWSATYSDNRAETEPTGDETLGNNDDLLLIIPEKGATITIPATGCVLTIAPSGSISVEAAYNDSTGVATVTDAQVPYSSNGVGLGCPGSGNASFTGTYKLNNVLADAS
jgi:hypothetical protein